MTSGIVGIVDGLWRFPVKSMRGEQLEQAELSDQGLVGDRAYGLIDTNTGKVVSAKSVRLFADLLNCRATFVEPTWTDHQLPPVRIKLPDGTAVTSDSGDIDRVLSTYFQRDITLTQTAPEDFTIDQYHPDISDLDPEGHRNVVVEQKLGSALFSQSGSASPVPIGAFFDLFPVTILTTSTLTRLNELRPQSRFDQRRFRMNVIIRTTDAGFVENEWVDRQLAISDPVRLRVKMPNPRCVMTTLSQDDLPSDTDILRTLTQRNRIDIGHGRLYPCVGVYAVVEVPGMIRIGDHVRLI